MKGCKIFEFGALSLGMLGVQMSCCALTFKPTSLNSGLRVFFMTAVLCLDFL